MPTKGIVIYGVGGVGTAVTRLCAARGWPVVAAVNRPGPKLGARLGTLAGVSLPRDVIVTHSLDTALAGSEADLAVVSTGDRLQDQMPVYEECLRRNLNVVSSGYESGYPSAVSEAAARHLDALARAHGVTFTGTGFQDLYRVGMLCYLVGACAAVERVHHFSLVDIGRHGPAAYEVAGVGLEAEAFARRFRQVESSPISPYRVFLQHAVEAAGWRIAEITSDVYPVFPDSDFERPDALGDFSPGRAIGAGYTTHIRTGTGTEVEARNELRLLAAGEEEAFEWTIDGSPNVAMRLTRLDSALATATQIVNRIPDVLAAAPGLVTLDCLPPMRPPWR
jgi:4-hydroxy-tetrahydrodipicolinate reductase